MAAATLPGLGKLLPKTRYTLTRLGLTQSCASQSSNTTAVDGICCPNASFAVAPGATWAADCCGALSFASGKARSA